LKFDKSEKENFAVQRSDKKKEAFCSLQYFSEVFL